MGSRFSNRRIPLQPCPLPLKCVIMGENRMRHYCLKLIGLVLILSLFPCACFSEGLGRDESSTPESPNFVTAGPSRDEGGQRWQVLSNRGTVLAEGTEPMYTDLPRLVFVDGDIIGLREGGGNAAWYTFYDVAQERVSEVFENVIDLRGETVLYTARIDGGWQIVLRNIFSGEILRSQPVDFDSAIGRIMDDQWEWDEEGAFWRITFPVGGNGEDRTVVFPLAQDLYPIRQNGLWGYMNRQGKTVIEPQWAYAEGFRGRYALVWLRTDETGNKENAYGGIIDPAGGWVLPPARYERIWEKDNWSRYIGGRDQGIYLLWGSDENTAAGFFDVPSGHYSGLQYEWVDGEWIGDVDPELACVTIGGKKGFVSRTTGEIRIPCRYDPLQYYCFQGDYCTVMLDDPMPDEWILIDRKGRELPMPTDCYLTGSLGSICAGNELIPVRKAVPGDEYGDAGQDEDGLCGYMDLRGNLVIEPQYAYAYGFREGLACVTLRSGEQAVITPENKIVAMLPDPVYRQGSSSEYRNGLLRQAHYSESGRLEYIAFLDRSCDEVFRLEAENLTWAGDPFDNGAAFYSVKEESDGVDEPETRCGLFNVLGEILTRPVFEVSENDLHREFSEGVFPITDAGTGRKGFIDERGQWAIAPVWDRADDFYHGLALVGKDGKLAYIDHTGTVVWEER